MSRLKDERGKGAKGGPDYFWAAASGRVRVQKSEAVMSTAAPALQVAGVRVPKKESAVSRSLGQLNVHCRFIEKAAKDGVAPDGNRFRVVLIQEGLGNQADGYYYTKDALKSAVSVFEGKKGYADHPSKMDDAVRPERSVRDIFGHYEDVTYVEADDGTARLEADVVVMPGDQYDWVRSMFSHAVEYSKKYPDKDFIGLSINASGDAEPMPAEEFLEKFDIVKSALPKVKAAVEGGLEEVKITNLIDSAVSIDAVTEAGAKGKVLELLEADMAKKNLTESEKKEADEKAKKEAEEKAKKEADEAAAAAADKDKDKDPAAKDAADDEGEDDEAKDTALIQDQLKKHGLVKENEEAEESTMQAAKHYQKAFKAAGHKGEEAASRAVEAMKCAHAAQESMKKESEEAAKKEADAKDKDAPAQNKESNTELLKIKGENAALKEKLAKREIADHLEKVLRESNLPRAVTKKFKESIKEPKSSKEIDEKFSVFMEGYRATGGDAGEGTVEDLSGCVVSTEKNEGGASGEGGVSSLEDCVTE